MLAVSENCETMASFLAFSFQVSFERSAPSNCTRPFISGSVPEMPRKRVVFPEPFGPMMPANAPSGRRQVNALYLKATGIAAGKVFYFEERFHFLFHTTALFRFELLSRTIKRTPPIMPVITPMGSSLGAMMVRATISHNTRKIPPLRNEAINSIR